MFSEPTGLQKGTWVGLNLVLSNSLIHLYLTFLIRPHEIFRPEKHVQALLKTATKSNFRSIPGVTIESQNLSV